MAFSSAKFIYNFIKKETLVQVFSCKFCKIFKNTFSYRTLPVVASKWLTSVDLICNVKVAQRCYCLSRPYPFKFFKGCLPQILLGPLLNTLSQIKLTELTVIYQKLYKEGWRKLKQETNWTFCPSIFANKIGKGDLPLVMHKDSNICQ